MSNKRILQFDTASQLENDDYLLIDHASEGTRKILASAVGGGGSAYSGATEPASNFGKNGDIYFQIENLFSPEFISASIWSSVSVTKKANGKFTIVMSGTGINSDEYVSYTIKNLEVGKEYTFKFSVQMSADATFYNQNRTYGLQFTDEYNGYNNSLSGTAGEFDDENNYMPFYKDTNSHDYECTITATAETMYMIFGFADVIDGTNNTLTVDDLECSIPYITNIYTKNNDTWIRYLPNSNGGGSGYNKTLLYNSGSWTNGATQGVDINLLDNLSNYDVIVVLTGTNQDNSSGGYKIDEAWYDTELLLTTNFFAHWAGYGTRWWQLSFTDTTFQLDKRGGDLTPEIYRIYGIKF